MKLNCAEIDKGGTLKTYSPFKTTCHSITQNTCYTVEDKAFFKRYKLNTGVKVILRNILIALVAIYLFFLIAFGEGPLYFIDVFNTLF